MWKVYALLSALFAALTAICAKVGVKNINSDLATAIRTSVILILTWGIVFFGKHQTEVREISHHTWLFLILSGVATGLSWLFYFKAIQIGDVSRVAPHRQVERCLHHYPCLPLPPRESRSASRYRGYPHRRRQHSDAFKMTVCPTVAHPPRHFSLK